MSILKSTGSGKHMRITKNDLLAKGYKEWTNDDHYLYRNSEERIQINDLAGGMLYFELKEEHIFSIDEYSFEIATFADLELVEKYWYTKRKADNDYRTLEALLNNVEFYNPLTISYVEKYEMDQRKDNMLDQCKRDGDNLVYEAEQDLHDYLKCIFSETKQKGENKGPRMW